MIRTIMGTIAGVLLAIAIIMLIESMGHAIWPPQPGLDLTGAQDTDALMATMPLSALIAVPVAWFLGVLVGAGIGNLIAGRPLPGWIVAGVVLAGGAYTVFLIPHPWWMVISAIILPLLAGWIATRTIRRA